MYRLDPIAPIHVGNLALRDQAKAGQVAVVIEQQMQFDRSLRASPLGPVEHAGAQLYRRTVETQKAVLEAELLSRAQLPALREQIIKEPLVELPRTMGVGI